MRLCFITYWSCPLTKIGVYSGGGMSIYILNLVNHLVEIGHTVDVFTRSHKENDENILDLHKNARIIHLKGLDDINQGISNFAESIITFIGNNNIKYDLIHSHYYLSGLIGIICKKKLDIPHFVTFHSLGAAKRFYLNENNKFRITSEKKVINNSDCIIVSTEVEKKELSKFYNLNNFPIEIVYPGVNHKIFRKIPKNIARDKISYQDNKYLILFVGRIDPVKGIKTLLDSLVLILKNHKDLYDKIQVILIGGEPKSRKNRRNDEISKIIKIISEKNLSDVVKLIGSRPNKMLPFYYNAADITVLPSVYESFGLVILEAMACGGCVVASRVGGAKFLIKDRVNGNLFKSGNPVGLSDVLLELLLNGKLREKIGKNAIITSNKYCWKKQAEKIENIYKKYL